MFYSYEILTSRKYGVATIWLVATLGAKSNTKKLTRKAICDVDVRRACEVIVEPEAPLALRLQSNLLYGVTRVYSQQCGYVLSDAQAAHMSMRAILKMASNSEIDLQTGKVRPDQLILRDDPAFLPDMALPALDLDISRLSVDPQGDSQRSTQSMLSIHSLSRSGTPQSVPGLDILSSSNRGHYQLPFDDPFGGSSAHKLSIGKVHEMFGDGEELMLPNDLFEIDGEGNVLDLPGSDIGIHRASIHPQSRLGSDSAASRRVRQEHEEVMGCVLPGVDADGDFNMISFGDDNFQLSDAEPFPEVNGAFMTGGLQGNDKFIHANMNDRIYSSEKQSSDQSSEEPSSISAEAPQRKKRALKKFAIDKTIELRNNDIIAFRENYIGNMAADTLKKKNHKGILQAKKNAFHYVFGSGLNSVGEGHGIIKSTSPLAIFSGESLIAKITGQTIQPTKRSKRDHAGAEEQQYQNSSPKRPRHEEEEVGRGFEENIAPLNFEVEDDRSSGIEVGREAPSVLADYPSSAIMPWNVSASLHSHQRAASSIGIGSQVGRRLTSVSPLIGRGSAVPGELDPFSLLHEDDNIMYGRDDDNVSLAPAAGFPSSSCAPRSGTQEFEMFGEAANVDTQTAETSQWVRQALDKEGNNFFKFVKNTIQEKTRNDLDLVNEEGDAGNNEFVTFQELFHEEMNTSMVVAHAFYHILSLATKGKIRVEQFGVEELEPFGEIRIGIAPLTETD